MFFPLAAIGPSSSRLRVDPNLTNWRDKAFWRKRATDVATRGQPPLKDKFQNLFNMTLIGAALLGALSEGGMQITLHPGEASYGLIRSVIETYPGAVARAIGFKGDYKKTPEICLERGEQYLQSSINLEFDST